MTAIKYAQTFCTVQDIIADSNSPGVDDARVFGAISEISEFLMKEIGWFYPVTLTHRFHGFGKEKLILPYPLLSITSITNDGTTLSASDYITKPDEGMWPYGPISHLIVDPDAANLGAWVDEEDGVVLVGDWGMYLRSASIGATVQDNPQTNAQTTLKVSNGSLVSPGMALLIETEQQHVTGWSDPTAGVTTLGAAITAVTDEVITLADASLVNVGEVLRVDFEQMRVRDRKTSNNTVLVTRGWNGSAKTTHSNAAAVDAYRTVTVTRGVNGTTAAQHAQAVAINRYQPPQDVNMLAKQMATLLINKARGGYQGREGNVELGTIFYHDVFTRDIETIKQQYFFGRVS